MQNARSESVSSSIPRMTRMIRKGVSGNYDFRDGTNVFHRFEIVQVSACCDGRFSRQANRHFVDVTYPNCGHKQ